MMIGLVTDGGECGCYVRTLRMLCTEKATVWSAPDGSDKQSFFGTPHSICIYGSSFLESIFSASTSCIVDAREGSQGVMWYLFDLPQQNYS